MNSRTVRPLAAISLALALSACQSVEYEAGTKALNGVWRGEVDLPEERDNLQAHALDGLVLTASLSDDQAHSGEWVLDDGELAGLFARRGPAGERDRDYSMLGWAEAYDRVEADLLAGGEVQGRLSLHYDHYQSDQYASLQDLAGVYSYYGRDLDVSMSIRPDGRVEAYDDAGCAYFGFVEVPDRGRNLYSFSLSVEGCALAGDYGFGLASLEWEFSRKGELTLPIWFDEQDRVETWTLQPNG